MMRLRINVVFKKHSMEGGREMGLARESGDG